MSKNRLKLERKGFENDIREPIRACSFFGVNKSKGFEGVCLCYKTIVWGVLYTNTCDVTVRKGDKNCGEATKILIDFLR